MNKILDEESVKRSVIKWLSRNKWTHIEFDAPHIHGVDIKARKGGRVIFIETKGESKSRQGNEVRFVRGLGQLATRMKVVSAPRAFTYALGLPIKVADIALRRIPWKFTQKLWVEIFAVNESGKVERYTWKDFKKKQNKT